MILIAIKDNNIDTRIMDEPDNYIDGEEELPEEEEIDVDAEPLIDDEFIIEDDTEIAVPVNALRIPDTERLSYNKLTKYERTALIGARAQQIALGSVPRVEVPKGMTNPIDIANKELEEAAIPLLIRRIVNENIKKYEVWAIKDLVI